MPALEFAEPALALDESPPVPLATLSTKDASFEPQATAHKSAPRAMKVVKRKTRIGSARREAADPAIARDTVAAVRSLLALLPVFTADARAARTGVS
jgi:hypothetical protein